MKAVVYQKYGSANVLELKEIKKPTPRKNELLIKIYATTVTPSDIMLRSGKYPLIFWLPTRLLYGVTNPRSLIPGYELAGVVESVGKSVTRFKPGDPVFGATMWKMSCTAEYICLSQNAALVIKPAVMTYEEAAAFCDGACTALNFLKKGNIQSGKKVLIYGASGSVGTFAIQLARYFDANVTGVCSTTNLDMVTSLGAHQVIDYTQEDFTQNGETYDLIFDTVGYSPFPECINSLKPDGVFVSTYLKMSSQIRGKWISLTSSKKVRNGMTTSNAKDLHFLKELIEAGEIKSVIDRRYPLEQIVAAHRYVEKGHKKGNVVITTCDTAPDQDHV